MNEEVRVEAENKGVDYILTGVTDNSEYAYRDFINNGIKKAEKIIKGCFLHDSHQDEDFDIKKGRGNET